ncbi:copper amine oxidase [Pontibacillus salicampi]|uniref:Copper amine oxidase n=1 Tax=Pontibacillus salicampi TaxID=1449801 RepID=A0ABV6LPZ6_9BACI
MNMKKTMMIIPLSTTILFGGTVNTALADHHKEPKPTVMTEAAELRTNLDHLLSEHAYLAVEAMRKGADGSADFEQAAEALNENAVDLSNAIGSVYGKEAGNQFEDMWKNHIGFFVDYVKATGAGNEEKKQKALDNLSDYRQEFSKFLESATEERLEADALAEGLQMHVNQLIGAFDEYVAGNYEKAYEYEREAINHMYGVSKGLSSAIVQQFPDKFNNTKAVTPATDLRSNLNHLLSEHAGLAAMAMQNGIDGSEDFEASAQALANNTDDLSNAIASVYGEEAGSKFKEMWSGHIEDFVSYVKATGAEDEEKQQAALDALADYRADFSKFLETATEERLKADNLEKGLEMHVNQLIGTFDSYVAEDYDQAYDELRGAYKHMLNPAKGLSDAFVNQFPDEFMMEMPSDMPKTGMGGTAEEGMSLEYILLGGFALTLAISTIAINRTRRESK